MSENNFNIIVLIPTSNCVDRIDQSINSIISQTYNNDFIKIVAVDNNSSDGTYERLLHYSINYGISVYRLSNTCSQAKLLYNSISYISFTNYKYITMLAPGDLLHRDFIEKCVEAMEEHSTAKRRMLLCEADVINNNGSISPQIPIFTDSCILKSGWSLSQFFTYGFDHRIQWFCLRDTLPSNLSDLAFCVDNTDWFNKALFSFGTEIIYINKTLASVLRPQPDDRLFELMLKLSLVTRFKLVRGVTDNEKFDVLDELDTQKDANYKLSLLALKYAYDDMSENKLDLTRKILLFAEMVFPEITNSSFYADACSSIENSEYSLPLLGSHCDYLFTCTSPPDGSILIDS